MTPATIADRIREMIQQAERRYEHAKDPEKRRMLDGRITVLEKRLALAEEKGW